MGRTHVTQATPVLPTVPSRPFSTLQLCPHPCPRQEVPSQMPVFWKLPGMISLCHSQDTLYFCLCNFLWDGPKKTVRTTNTTASSTSTAPHEALADAQFIGLSSATVCLRTDIGSGGHFAAAGTCPGDSLVSTSSARCTWSCRPASRPPNPHSRAGHSPLQHPECTAPTCQSPASQSRLQW